ncbi:MAG: ArsA-related P-loop ATPase [Myxococcota bacterium]|nr:ArsA-related P-loop ATPase [Myxococcota bacterium]
MSGDLHRLLAERRIVVCVGTGGVGKTTVAAALALAAARQGQRSLVVTIDPARRLADALGLAELGNEPHALPSDRLVALGAAPDARMEAMMLDMKRTFDDLVQRFAPDEASVERILANPIYQHVSDALAGSAEYSAMEKVYELSEREDLDLIVLDTPPSQHALDFLEAPERLIGFLESRVVQVLVHPAFAGARLGFRLFQRGVQQALRLIERVSGMGFLEDLSEFLLSIEGMSEGFRERALSVRELLFGSGSAFVLAAGPTVESVAMADGFLDRLVESGADVRALVLNRVRVWPESEALPDPDSPAAVAALADALGDASDEAAVAALRAARSYVGLVQQDAMATEKLRGRAAQSGCEVCVVPEFSRDVHDLDGLARVASHLCPNDRPND